LPSLKAEVVALPQQRRAALDFQDRQRDRTAEHALGVVTLDTATGEMLFGEIIGRNTKYPASNTQPVQPTTDFQESVTVQVIEGDPARPIDDDDNVVLATWKIPPPEPRRKADARLDITYRYDLDGIMHVRVEDHRTRSVLMDGRLEYGLAQRWRRQPE
jgi:molecular chaperone DnaK (HSP70)